MESGLATSVIVVLGAAVWPGGVPSPALERRVLHAVGLASRAPGSRLLMTGGLGQHPPAEARVMAQVAVRTGFPRERVIEECMSHSTLESAERCTPLLAQLGHRGPVVLVSDPYHLRRAALAFRLHGIRADVSGPARGDNSLRREAQEAIKLPWLLLRFALRRISMS